MSGTLVCDWHDFCDDEQSSFAFTLLERLHAQRDDFCCTLFAIPGRCTLDMLGWLPEWIQLGVHGWLHPDPHECEDWTKEQVLTVLDDPIVEMFFVNGWCSPGWNVSDGTYEALLERGFWISDHPKNNMRRPSGLRTHLLGAPGSWHGHIANVCGNGIQETFEQVEQLVKAADGFEFMSEQVTPWA